MPRPSFAPACLTTTGVLTVLVLFQTVHVQGSCDCLCCSGGTCTPTVVGVAATRAACLATFGTACGACGSMSSPGVCAPVCDLPPLPRGGTRYNYTGAAQTYVVPAGVQTLNITAAGSEGGPAHNGFLPAKGGLSTAQLSVHPGQTLQVYVGGPGREANSFATAAGGFNGGGTGQSGTSGGGGSDVRTSPSLDSRVVVAGAGAGSAWSGGVGGAGGGDSGEAGKTGYDGKRGGGPGTQAIGGACGEGGRDTCAGKAGKAGNCSTSSTLCSSSWPTLTSAPAAHLTKLGGDFAFWCWQASFAAVAVADGMVVVRRATAAARQQAVAVDTFLRAAG